MQLGAHITIIGHVKKRPEKSQNSVNENSIPIHLEVCELILLILQTIVTGGVEVHVRDIVRVEKTYRKRMFGEFQSRHYSTASSSSQSKPTATEITSNEYKHTGGDASLLKWFNDRQHTCGSLRIKNAGSEVSLVGWIHKRAPKFVQLEDGYGVAQIIINNDLVQNTLNEATESSLLLFRGRVVARQQSHITYNNPTGEVELFANSVRILNLTTGDDSPQVTNGNGVNKFTYRTHNCGELRAEDAGKQVTLCGWLEYSRMNKFFTLRDGYGQMQVLIPEELIDSVDLAQLNYESILNVNGTVQLRPLEMINKKMKTGEIELILNRLEVLNAAKDHLPIELRSFNRANEPLRLEYRYIDLRFADMQHNLRTRSNVLMKMREYLINQAGFVEVETPTLFRRTPGVRTKSCYWRYFENW